MWAPWRVSKTRLAKGTLKRAAHLQKAEGNSHGRVVHRFLLCNVSVAFRGEEEGFKVADVV